MTRTAKAAIRSWYKTHPKTFCPVVGEAICRAGGCDNAKLRADALCNIERKTRMFARGQAGNDGRPWLADLRISADKRRYLINFPFDRLTLADFKSVIPDADRRYDAESREWQVDRRYWSALNAMFSNFAEWDLDILNSR